MVGGFFDNLARLGQTGSDSEDEPLPRPRRAVKTEKPSETDNKGKAQETKQPTYERHNSDATQAASSYKGSDAFLLPKRNEEDEEDE